MARDIRPLKETHPELCEEWDYQRNNDLTPDKISHGSTKKVYWKCQNGHSFVKSPNERTNKVGCERQGRTYIQCPYCSGALPIPGETSFEALYPKLMEEWDWEENKNRGLNPDLLLPHSCKKASWICKKDPKHKWETSIGNRVSGGRKQKGSGCPYCDGKSFKEGITDLETCFPEIADEWDYEKNDDTPNHVHKGSTKKAWWICPKGHSYESSIISRTRMKTGCSICAGKIIIPETSLAKHFPEIAAEWDYEKNSLTPEEAAPKSMKKAWWICPKGHPSYEMPVAARTESGCGCPYCASKKVAPGESFADLHPELLKEWDWEKNEDDPYQLTSGSSKAVHWECRICGHKWKSVLNTRVSGSGCPQCRRGNTTSFAEQAMFIAICELLGKDKVINRANVYGVELDIYIPELSLALEPGNWKHHQSKVEKDNEKRNICNEHGITLFTIYDDYKDPEPPFDSHCLITKQYLGSNKGKNQIIDMIIYIMSKIGVTEEEVRKIDWVKIFERAIAESHNHVPYEKSISALAPDIAVEWHPTANGILKPENVAAGSNQKRYWLCPEGHEYSMSPIKRIREHRGCNICSNKVADPRYNSISKLRPDMAEILSSDNDYDADDTTPVNTTRLLKWDCPHCGESFEQYSYILNRASRIVCPHCGEILGEK